jgi:hypothetical protein
MNPYVIAGVIYAEATFRPQPPAGRICRQIYKFWNKPGPQPRGYPRLIRKCRWIGKTEIGIMQVIPNEVIARRCFKEATGLEVKKECCQVYGKRKCLKRYPQCISYRQYKRELKKPKININVATCDIASKCRRCKRNHGKYHHTRLGWKTPPKIRRFFYKRKSLMKYFCVAHYNWGNVYRPVPSRYVNSWRYPLKVIRFARKLMLAVKNFPVGGTITAQKSGIISNGKNSSTALGVSDD